ncbi:hypothetical protein Q8A73_008269 [Channa argus]|nr:hypothetical protein Q8A73_008269 [Channa argus]
MACSSHYSPVCPLPPIGCNTTTLLGCQCHVITDFCLTAWMTGTPPLILTTCFEMRSFDIGDDRCLWGGGGGGGDAGKKTIFDCLWVKADSSRQGGLQRLAGGAESKSQPPLSLHIRHPSTVQDPIHRANTASHQMLRRPLPSFKAQWKRVVV